MKIHKEGYPSILITLAVVLIVNLTTHIYFFESTWIRITGYIVSVFLLLAILQFFRNPKRTIVKNVNHVLSGADGKVVVIEEIMEEEYFRDKRIQVSVFMSPVNVHLNRYPIGGIIKYIKYHAGTYLVAWHPKSSTDNERTSIVVEDENKREVMFRQIAGAMAKRIVYYGEVGSQVKQGSECGFIKFGSRVDLILPSDAEIKVGLGEKVKGGETVIASYPVKPK